MARKSLARRLAETQVTLELWKTAGMEQDRPAQFMRDMMVRMQRNRGMSTGQRKFLDSLIEQGAPQTHNTELCDRIEAAKAVAGMESCAQPLSDFQYKLSKGWNLSPKQRAFLDNMLEQADKLKETGLPVLSDADKLLVEGLLRSAEGQNSYYWSHRPGAHRAVEAARQEWTTHGTLTERNLMRLKSSYKSVTRRYEAPRMVPGGLGYLVRDTAMIVSTPYFNGVGILVQDILVNGCLQTVSEDRIGKRRARMN